MLTRLLLTVLALGLLPGLTAIAGQDDLATTDETDFQLNNTMDLLEICTVDPDQPYHTEAIHFCEGFLLGGVWYHDAISDREHMKRLICYPEDASRDDGVVAFVTWARANQSNEKLMNDVPIMGLVQGLAARWPCPKS